MDTFRLTVWRDVASNLERVFPASPDGYGRAFDVAQVVLSDFGATTEDAARFVELWPDLGSEHPTAARIGDCAVSVQWILGS